ncbi:tetratricopeptide repeat protein [Streptosporangium roseum]|uniref:tetratricopeptide repeat protein n=1 Tax=Streptosporangium roseum TaxID=2001 RepID=UPI003332D7E3
MKTSAKALIAAGVLGLAATLTAGAALIPGGRTPPATAAPPQPAEIPISATSLKSTVQALTARLQRLPGDHQAWARLGSAYVQQARVTADPSLYPRAEQALARSAALSPGGFAALTGQAALAAGRHDFAEALRLAKLSEAANPYGHGAQAVLADAYTQLGRYGEATRAIDRMMELHPGVAAFTRASYDAELRGDRAMARRMLEHALDDALSPADVAYCRHYLGELALHSGDLRGATEQYRLALEAAPDFTPALAGAARAAALGGRLAEAAGLYGTVVGRLPLAQYVTEYAEVLSAAGRDPSEQWALLRAQRDLMEQAGVNDDLTWAEFEADHGSPARAVEHAEAEYGRHPNVVAADALAWALHRDGRDREALPYAREATATGWRNALLHHHRAEIERALGLAEEAARSTGRARDADPAFSPALPALARFS